MRLFSVGNISMDLVNDMVSGLTHSMTATLRNLPVGSSEKLVAMEPDDLKMATGQVLTTQTCIHAEWGCPGKKPANANPRRPTWKSSPLALLFHGIESDLRSRNQDFSTIKQMDTLANEVNAHLVHMRNSKQNGWKLTTV
ncbi:carboxylic ester hydrolase [Colletotrichum asianum]|uniref:Carboxylic ester hydrolase n=1 Tax=Colletotrichum asianum TaxID=702518 RepID=A0A8H3W3L2_9PEZI|nr:carboxylic ester hydrolase [Colletotrichum asianum]